jgi:mRNA interferase MazF
MALQFHPKRGTIVTVDFDQGFTPPEMVKRRLAVVISPPISARRGLITIVPLSTTEPIPKMSFQCEIEIPFALPPYWGHRRRWVKGDMITAVGFHRVDLLNLGKGLTGKRIYQKEVLPPAVMDQIGRCVLASIGLLP